jgi:hypothetical protein
MSTIQKTNAYWERGYSKGRALDLSDSDINLSESDMQQVQGDEGPEQAERGTEGVQGRASRILGG